MRKTKFIRKKVLTSTNKEATIQAKLAIFRLSCNPLLFVIIFDHTSVVKQDSAIFRPQPSLLSLWTEQRLSNMEFSALDVKKYKRYFSTKCFKRWVKTMEGDAALAPRGFSLVEMWFKRYWVGVLFLRSVRDLKRFVVGVSIKVRVPVEVSL